MLDQLITELAITAADNAIITVADNVDAAAVFVVVDAAGHYFAVIRREAGRVELREGQLNDE